MGDDRARGLSHPQTLGLDWRPPAGYTPTSRETDFEHRWLIDPRSGEIVLWTSDTGIDGQNPVDLEELSHLILIEPALASDD
jgi:hypothetical protein